jgi:3,4-dihydroxy 2-butanone 4-phosphate synthase/GTP cyclohydrolase II
MQLSHYLRWKGESRADFARRTGLSEGMISLLCRHETWMSRDTAKLIMRATKGQVTPTDFLEAVK